MSAPSKEPYHGIPTYMGVWWLLLAAAACFLAVSDVHPKDQISLSVMLVVAIIVLRFMPKTAFFRLLVLAIGAFTVIRYFAWRATTTLEYVDPLSYAFTALLYLAECYGIAIFLLTVVINAAPRRRQPIPIKEEPDLPTIDVLVPSYNEPYELLGVTLTGAMQMDYPKDRMRVYLLDDGGTDQKCNQKNQEAAKEARERRIQLTSMCEELGVTYLTRERNEHAKAGNLNEALKKTQGELVVIFDADHVPTSDFLQNTVGCFIKDPKMFLVQTPHFFLNPDPVERNLGTFDIMPGENEMFYRSIQHGLDRWNSSFFCGSGAVLRRSILNETNGFSGQSITEDAETAIELHKRGYHSAYIGIPMIAGLAAESVNAFVIQRMRWSQGMIQIFRLKGPIFSGPGLSNAQRLCYLNSCIFWFFPFPRLMYMLAPSAFLLFDMQIYRAYSETFLAFAMPYMITVVIVSHYLFGRTRWLLISEIYELVQSVFCFPVLIQALIRPRAGKFNVTPKGQTLTRSFISSMAVPFYFLLALNVACMVFGIMKLMGDDSTLYLPTGITMFWAGLNLVFIGCVLGVFTESRQLRQSPRFPVTRPVRVKFKDRDEAVPGMMVDASAGGCGVRVLRDDVKGLRLPVDGTILLDEEGAELKVEVVRMVSNHETGPNEALLGSRLMIYDKQTLRTLVRVLYGSSEAWLKFQEARQSRNPGIFWTLGYILLLALRGYSRHLRVALQMFGRSVKSPLD